MLILCISVFGWFTGELVQGCAQFITCFMKAPFILEYTRVWRGTDACGNPAEAAVRHAPRSLSSTRHVKTPEDPAIRLYSSTQRATLTCIRRGIRYLRGR